MRTFSIPKSTRLGIAVVVAIAISAIDATAQPPNYPARRANAASATSQSIRATFTVAPGQSIQAAVDSISQDRSDRS